MQKMPLSLSRGAERGARLSGATKQKRAFRRNDDFRLLGGSATHT